MRVHRTHEIIAPWSIGATPSDAESLAAVRIEAVLRRRRPAFVLDFYLHGAAGASVIPMVLADPSAIVDRDRDPLIWPLGTPGGDALTSALAARVLPELQMLVLSAERFDERVLRFVDAPRFDAARAAGCFGAAPLREALTRLAPFHYARRFARGRSVRIDCADAVGGWALLRSISTAGVAPARSDPAAAGWYGDPPAAVTRADVALIDAAGDPADAPCVIRLDADGPQRVEVVDPLPLDVGVVFDPAEGPVRRWFAVERVREPVMGPAVPAYVASGGSAGRVAVILGRADAARLPSADTDEAAALAAALAAEGFDAFRAEAAEELAGADLVHVLGTRDGARVRDIVETAHRAGIPVALHAYDESADEGGWWGAAVTRHCFDYGSDERDVESYLALLARRAVSAGPAGAEERYAPPQAGVADAAAALRDADVVFAADTGEAEAVRARARRAGPIEIVAPVAAAAQPRGPVGALVGSDPYALIHAPIGPLGNQLIAARVAADARIPLVIAGPVADASYLELVREFGGPALIVLPFEPASELAAALRAAASVVVDPAWIGDGGSRLAAAAFAGARLAVADRRRIDIAGAQRFDAADARSLARALGAAWDEALRGRQTVMPATLAATAPNAAVRAIVRGYAHALAAASPKPASS